MRDAEVRAAAFDWLREQVGIHGDVLPWRTLTRGFEHRGHRVPLTGQQGIFKPRVLEHPLSIRTAPSRPYEDGFGDDGLLRYRYRKQGGPDHPDNVGLRRALRLKLPLIYLHGIVKARYLAVWPVYVVDDDPLAGVFTVAVDDARIRVETGSGAEEGFLVAEDDPTARRRYVTGLVRHRLHQRTFREKVLRAYRSQCALCRLRHERLLDAAHIIADREEEGEPTVSNGVALCKLHHAAFDSFFLAIRPDYRIEVRRDILEESDGPMLIHGLQELHHRDILLPRADRHRPARELLERRYRQFLEQPGH